VNITSRFKVLLAEKEIRDGRNYTLRDVAAATGASIYVVTGLANNTLREFPREALEGVCQFLGCTLGDLLEYNPPSKANERPAMQEPFLAA
jgi:DNA-binding Xre family transcriptional regulator